MADLIKHNPVAETARSIMLEMAGATREQEMWERRFQYLCRVFEPDKRFVDQNGKWGLRDFLAYAGDVCGFTKGTEGCAHNQSGKREEGLTMTDFERDPALVNGANLRCHRPAGFDPA